MQHHTYYLKNSPIMDLDCAAKQVQPNDPSIQATLQEKFLFIRRRKSSSQGLAETDSGVHPSSDRRPTLPYQPEMVLKNISMPSTPISRCD